MGSVLALPDDVTLLDERARRRILRRGTRLQGITAVVMAVRATTRAGPVGGWCIIAVFAAAA
jgi:hypothetical protein